MIDEEDEDSCAAPARAEGGEATFCAKSALASAWMPGVGGLAGVVEEQREIEHGRVLELLKELLVFCELRLGRIDQAIEFLDADEGVLVGRVAMEKLVLHEAGQLAELRDVTPEEIDLVHGAQDRADLALARADGEEGFPRRACAYWKVRSTRCKPAADEMRAVRGLSSSSRCCMCWNRRIIRAGSWVKTFERSGVEQALDGCRSRRSARRVFGFALAQEAEKAVAPCAASRAESERRSERSSVILVDVARVLVVVAHEGLAAPQDILLRVVQLVGDLQLLAEHDDIRGAFVQVVQFGPDAQEEIVGAVELAALRLR